MFVGAHVILYSADAEADRGFIAEVLGFPHVDTGGGWLIFRLPPAEVAVHPSDGDERHEFYLMCEDIEALFDKLAAAGVEVPCTSHCTRSPTTCRNDDRRTADSAVRLTSGGYGLGLR